MVGARADVSSSAAQNCYLRTRATLDMDMDDTGRFTIPVSINGVSKRMMVDTGAAMSLISRDVVSEFKLTEQPAYDKSLMGFSGAVYKNMVEIAEFGLGKMRGENFKIVVKNEWMDAAGLLGNDFLFYHDLDFDFANAKLHLISPDHCPGQVVYWTKEAYGVVPFEFINNHIRVEVKLDGQPVVAILDTGAPDTVMGARRVSRIFDVPYADLVKSRQYPFKTLEFGSVNVVHPDIALVSDNDTDVLGDGPRHVSMIIGMTVLRQLHLYISYKEKKIYVTPATQY